MRLFNRVLWVILLTCAIAECPNPMSVYAFTWEFNIEGSPEGWLTNGDADGMGSSADLIVSEGILHVPVAPPPLGTMLVSPPLKLDASLYDRLILRVRVSEGAYEGQLDMTWRTEGVPVDDPLVRKRTGVYGDPLVWSDEWQEVVLTKFTEEYWVGTVIRFDLRFVFRDPEDTPEEVWVDWLTFTGIGAEAQGDPMYVTPGVATGAVFDRYASYRIQGIARVSGGDVDSDGDMDLIATASSRPSGSFLPSESFIHVLFNAGEGTFPESRVYPMEPGGMGIPHLVDLDKDGDLDMVVDKQTSTGSTLLVLEGLGEGRFSTDPMVLGEINPVSDWFGDLDGDGDADIAICIYETYEPKALSILLNRGDGSFSQPVVYSVGGILLRIVGADLDGDGDMDLAVTRRLTQNRPGERNHGEIVIFLNEGDGALTQLEAYSVGPGPLAIVSGDFDEDGDADLVVADDYDNTVSVLLNQGDGMFSDPLVYPVSGEPFVLMSEDFTGDEHLDLVIGHILDTNIWLLAGNGDGTFLDEGIYPVSGSIYGLFAGDMDGDGDLDVVTVDCKGDNICILLNRMRDRTTGVVGERRTDVPGQYMLHLNYPNPFNASTTIRYDLPFPGGVRLCIYDLMGQRIRALVDERKPAGSHSVTWDGKDDAGKKVSSGMYVCRLEGVWTKEGTSSQTRKVTLIR